ncbi:MAG: TetR/AcrR family transcriptional regulator [Rhodobacteraceae bacterium]|nr:TetR/AcrR family transcriptional regulator [Paracoccaceae bacterium]
MKPHPSDKLADEKREKLFGQALKEFSAQGFKNASLNRIISAMGMSKSSFYHYFENKADLYQCMIEHVTAPYMLAYEAFDFDALDAESFWSSLQNIVREQTLSMVRAPETKMIGRIALRAMDDPEERDLSLDLIEFATQWSIQMVRRGQALGMVRRDLPETMLLPLLVGITTCFDRWLFEHWDGLSERERIDIADQAIDAYMRLLQPGSTPNQTSGGQD